MTWFKISEFYKISTWVFETCFKYDMEGSHIKIGFTFEILVSHMELKHFYLRNIILICESSVELASSVLVLDVGYLLCFLIAPLPLCNNLSYSSIHLKRSKFGETED